MSCPAWQARAAPTARPEYPAGAGIHTFALHPPVANDPYDHVPVSASGCFGSAFHRIPADDRNCAGYGFCAPRRPDSSAMPGTTDEGGSGCPLPQGGAQSACASVLQRRGIPRHMSVWWDDRTNRSKRESGSWASTSRATRKRRSQPCSLQARSAQPGNPESSSRIPCRSRHAEQLVPTDALHESRDYTLATHSVRARHRLDRYPVPAANNSSRSGRRLARPWVWTYRIIVSMALRLRSMP
jgi:hypothetical protein